MSLISSMQKIVLLIVLTFFTTSVFAQNSWQIKEIDSAQSEPNETTSTLQELDTDATAQKVRTDNDCQVDPESKEWLDRVRAGTHTQLCNTVSWVDGLFGEEEKFEGDKFSAKLALGVKHDEDEGIDPRVRVRLRTKLPNVSRRFDAFIGRVEEDSYISNTEIKNDRLNNVGLRSTNDDRDEWLIGLGYRKPRENNNGWDTSVGAKLRSGLSPYAKVAYNYLFKTREDRYIQTKQTAFWRRHEGYGFSSNLDYGLLFGDDDIWINHFSTKYTDKADQWEWFADTTWHHSFNEKKGISSSLYIRGEEENEVSVPEYGMTFTYIQPFLRDWLYVETGIDFRWEKEYEWQDAYQSAIRIGIQFEMIMGNYYRYRRPR